MGAVSYIHKKTHSYIQGPIGMAWPEKKLATLIDGSTTEPRTPLFKFAIIQISVLKKRILPEVNKIVLLQQPFCPRKGTPWTAPAVFFSP